MSMKKLDLKNKWIVKLILCEDEEFIKELKTEAELNVSDFTRFVYAVSYRYIDRDIKNGLTQKECFEKYKLTEPNISSASQSAAANRILEDLYQCDSKRMNKKNFIDRYHTELKSLTTLNDVITFLKNNYKNKEGFNKLELYLKNM